MRLCCYHRNLIMAKLIQVRDVPEETHRRLKARAAEEGRTLSDYVRRELVETAARPTHAEIFDRLRSMEPIALEESPAEIIRAERDARER